MPSTNAAAPRGGRIDGCEPSPGAARWPLALVFALALLVRLIHVWGIRRAPFFTVLMGDARAYDEWARQIAAGDWIGHDVFYQAPLYPYFLGLVYAIGGHSLLLARVCQAILGSASCVLLAATGRRLFGRGAGLAAGVGLAVYAPAIFFDGLLQKSVLDVFFVCAALWIVSLIVERPERRRGGVRADRRAWLALGLALGGLSLTRENALVFIVVIVAWALLAVRHGRRLAAAGAFLAGLAVVLVPVAARNSIIGGGFYVTTSQFGPNFYIGNNPRANGSYQSLRYGRGAPEYERQDATELAETALHRTLTPGEVSSYWTDRALEFITSQPGAWLKLMGRKIVLLWNATEMVDTEDQETYADWSLPLRLGGPIFHFGVLVPLALLGAILTWDDRKRLALLYALLLAYAASVAVFYVFGRYRYPMVPLLVLFAAAGLARITRRVSRPAVVLPVAAAAVFCNWPTVPANAMRAVTENNLGAALMEAKRFPDAEAHYHRAIALQPDYAPAYANLGVALRAEGRLDEAAVTYRRALALQPDYPDAEYNLANVLMQQGRAAEAAGYLQRALETIPGAVDVHTNLGVALASEGKIDEAIAEFRRAVAIDPKSTKARRDLADALSARGAHDEAIAELRRAVAVDPADGSSRYDLGSELLEAGQLDDAIGELREAIRLAPDSAEAHNNLGIALGSQGRLDEAIAEFRRALEIRPGFADAQRNLQMALSNRPGIRN